MNKDVAIVLAAAAVVTAAIAYKIHVDNIERQRAESRKTRIKESIALTAAVALAL